MNFCSFSGSSTRKTRDGVLALMAGLSAFGSGSATAAPPLGEIPGAGIAWPFPDFDSGTARSAVLGPALSYHQQRTHAKQPYNEQNRGIGFERRGLLRSADRWEAGIRANFLEDSFAKPALFLDTQLTHSMLRLGDTDSRIGLTLGAAYKTSGWEDERDWVGYAGPTLVIRHRPSGLSLSTVYVYRRNASTDKVNGVFTLQAGLDF